MMGAAPIQPPPLPRKRRGLPAWQILLIVLGGILGMGVLALALIGSAGPGSAVVSGARLKPWDAAAVRRIAGLETNEQIRFFYSSALLHIEEDGNLLTDRAVYSFYKEEGTTVVERASFAEIADVEMTYSRTVWEDSVLQVNLTNEEVLVLLLSHERGGDRLFHDALQKEIGPSKPAP